VPTHNGLPEGKAVPEEVAAEARNADVARAVENGLWVKRADVAGRCRRMVSYGSSEIVAPNGAVVRAARPLREDLVTADLAM
jgi:5-aminopentanamidase